MTEDKSLTDRSLIIEVTKPAFDIVEKRLELLEKKVEEQDKLTANMLRGFLEMNSAIEQVISEILAERSPEDEAKFRKQLNERYKNHLKMIQEMSLAAGAASNPEEIAESIRAMVEQSKGGNTK